MSTVTIDKLPVGTKVKIIDAGWGCSGCNGSVGVITTKAKEVVGGLTKNLNGVNIELTNSPHGTGLPEVWRVHLDCKYKLINDPHSKQFTKSDLQDGDIIVRQNGSVEICIVSTGTLVCEGGGWNSFDLINEDLTFDKPLPLDINYGYDIVRVYRPRKPSNCCFNNYKTGDLVYERPISDISKWTNEIVDHKES